MQSASLFLRLCLVIPIHLAIQSTLLFIPFIFHSFYNLRLFDQGRGTSCCQARQTPVGAIWHHLPANPGLGGHKGRLFRQSYRPNCWSVRLGIGRRCSRDCYPGHCLSLVLDGVIRSKSAIPISLGRINWKRGTLGFQKCRALRIADASRLEAGPLCLLSADS